MRHSAEVITRSILIAFIGCVLGVEVEAAMNVILKLGKTVLGQ